MADSPELEAWVRAFEEHLGGRAPRPDVPLDLRGTAFQIRVWRFLLGIREGAVLSYTEVAAGIGAPKAVRAAASACAANRIAVLVPCHRVLRGDGGLGGYRWGIDRKRALLDRERATARGQPTQCAAITAR
jgi:AraC family transcriptional regulator of adaptative response/methylated-DNA-[protein]-cysteine methyltransferase